MARPIHILLIGYYGYANAGDECVLSGIQCALNHNSSKAFELRALSGDPASTQNTHRIKSYFRYSPVAVLQAMAWCDCLVLGGGSLIQDATSKRSAIYYLWLIRLAFALKKKVFLWAQGFGPLSDAKLRSQASFLLRKCQGITVRDEESRLELRGLGVDQAVLTADPAFLLSSSTNLSDHNSFELDDSASGLLGISLRQWPSIENTQETLSIAIQEFASKSSLQSLYIPFQNPADREISDIVACSSQTPTAILSTNPSPAELVRMFQELSIVLGMRLHSLILAAKAAVPFVGLSYDPKVERFCKSSGMPYLKVHEIASERLAEMLMGVWVKRDFLASSLKQFVDAQQQLAERTSNYFWRSVE